MLRHLRGRAGDPVLAFRGDNAAVPGRHAVALPVRVERGVGPGQEEGGLAEEAVQEVHVVALRAEALHARFDAAPEPLAEADEHEGGGECRSCCGRYRCFCAC